MTQTGKWVRRRPATLLLITASIALFAATTLIAICLDATPQGRLAWIGSDVWDAVVGRSPREAIILWDYRLPRVLAAAVIGGGLAAAGCALQATLRNPLAEPYTLGISSGASLAAVAAIRFGLDASPLGHNAIGLAALVGALVTVALVWRLARVGQTLPAATLLLAGITLAMISSAATLAVQYSADFTQVYRVVRWMMGGLDGVGQRELGLGGAAIAVATLAIAAMGRGLNAVALGADTAASVGVNPARTTLMAFALASTIVGASIALAGPIGFIGLMVPHAMRALVGPDHHKLVPVSVAAGAILLTLCDTVARLILAEGELPVGVVTALLGGPFFLYLLTGEKRRAGLWGGSS